VRFSDTAAIKSEQKDTLTVDLLYAHVVAGPPDTTPPAAPAGLTPTPNSAEVLVELYWTANTEPDLAGYKVYRSLTSGSGYAALTPSPIAGTTYIDPVPAPGTYYYVITAVDASGNESDPSIEASATVEDLAPAAPANLAATAGDTQVSLAWTANSEPDVAGFNVYRSTIAGGPYSPVNTVLVTSPGYVDSGLTNGTAYFYVVSAVDVAENESAYSAEVSATPSAQQTSTLHVEAISMTITKVAKNYRAKATVLIHDQAEAAGVAAVVTGDWYFKGALVATGSSGTTAADGTVAINSPSKSATTGDVFRFVVTGVTLAGFTYDPGQNVVTEASIPVP
jgi:fibronectin type 3 domain-containing protein